MPLDNATMPADDPFAEHNAKPSCIMFPVGIRLISWKGRNGDNHDIKSHKAIVRLSDDGTSATDLDVVGIGYRLIHNKQLFARVEDTMRKKIPSHCLHGVQVTDRVSGHGRICYREYIFPNLKCNIGGGARSDIAFRTIVMNGYGGSALCTHSGAIEFYCSNGMISGEYQSTYNRHTSGLEVHGIDGIIERSLDTFASNEVKWRQWANTPVKHTAAMELFKELANSTRLKDNLTTQYMKETDQRGDNLWAVYSALTYYASHTDGEFKLRSTTQAQDSVATTMLMRELKVAKWVESDAWKKLELA